MNEFSARNWIIEKKTEVRTELSNCVVACKPHKRNNDDGEQVKKDKMEHNWSILRLYLTNPFQDGLFWSYYSRTVFFGK